MNDIQLSREKAIEIIDFYMKGERWYKVEKMLYDKGIIEDTHLPSKEVWDVIQNGSNELLLMILNSI